MLFRLISFVVLLTACSECIAKDVKLPVDLVSSPDSSVDASNEIQLGEQESLIADSIGSPSTDIIQLVDTSIVIPLVDLKEVGVDNAILTLFRPHKINVWVSSEVTGDITVYLTDVSLLDAFGFIIDEKDLRYVIENKIIRVFPTSEEEKYLLELSYDNQLLSLDFEAVPLVPGVRRIIDATGENIVVEQGTTGFLSGKLKNIDFEKGIDALFSSNGFELELREGVFYIRRPSDAAPGGLKRSVYQVNCLDDRVTLDVRNADLQKLVEQIVSSCGLQLVLYGNLSGKITAQCAGISVDQALSFILSGTEYTFRQDRDVYRVGNKSIEEMRVSM